MIRGFVNARHEPMIKLQVRGLYGTTEIDAMVDTGYSGFLTLAASVIHQMGLIRCGHIKVVLADDSVSLFDAYSADVERNGSFENVVIAAAGEQCLVGMGFMEGYELRIEAKPGGSVDITKL